MGEYAEYALAHAMSRGWPLRCGGEPPRRSTPRPCRLCNKGIRGGRVGMVNHLKAKHGMKGTDARRFVTQPTQGDQSPKGGNTEGGSVHASAGPPEGDAPVTNRSHP